jgi:hypothetical protein
MKAKTKVLVVAPPGKRQEPVLQVPLHVVPRPFRAFPETGPATVAAVTAVPDAGLSVLTGHGRVRTRRRTWGPP